MIRRELARYGHWLIVIAAMIVIAAGSALFIFAQQRLRTPLADRYALSAEFASASGLAPGLGQPVNVAGVRVGDVVDAHVHDGRARIEMAIEPGKLARVYADARALLRPNTPLKDMQIELQPGSPHAGPLRGGVIRAARTAVPVDADDLTRALDGDTRDYMSALIAAVDRGTRGRGRDLRAVMRALGPTARQTREIGALLAARRRELRRATHNLAVLSRAAASRDEDLADAVAGGNATLQAIARQEAALSEAAALLPGVLRDSRLAVEATTDLGVDLVPALRALQPGAERLPAAIRSTGRLVSESLPLVRIAAPVVRESAPLVRDLRRAARDLVVAAPHVKQAFEVLDHVANELTYEPPGERRSFLFWMAWAVHNLASVVSTQDAHGAVIRGLGLVSCSSIADQPGLAMVLGAILGSLPVCPS